MHVGQCEACEGWLLARELKAARVDKPMLAVRRYEADMGIGIPGMEEPLVVYFCADCVAAMQDPVADEPTILRPGDPGFATARRSSVTEP